MFITPFIAGVFATIGAEVLLFIITFGIVAGLSPRRNNDDNDNQSNQ